MIVVSDTSVITSLIQIGQVSLLSDLHGTVLIPEAVHEELQRTHPAIPSFLKAKRAEDRVMVARLEAELDLGEAEAITLAKETNADLLLIDEKLGRQIAVREGLRIAGLIALVVEGKQRGIVESVRDFVTELEERAGFRVSGAVKEEAFRQAGELKQ
jgi:uncharacterized protein